MQYLIRKKNNIDIEISKFEDDNEPLDVYTISSRGCTCPAAWRRKTCKHTRMAKFWTSNLNSETGVVLGLNENNDPYKIRMVRPEENVLHLVEKVIIAKQNSKSEWAINYWTIVLNRLKVRYPANER